MSYSACGERPSVTAQMTLPAPARGGVPQRRAELPAELGECYSDLFPVDTGVTVVRSRYHPVRDLSLAALKENDSGTLVLTFGTDGHSAYEGKDGTLLSFKAGFTTVSSYRNTIGNRRYQGGDTVSQLRVLIEEPVLDRYVGIDRRRELLAAPGVAELSFGKTSPALAAQAAALGNLLARPEPSLIDLHANALTLLAEHLRQLRPETPRRTALSDADMERIEKAHDLMVEHMDRDLTVAYLCHEVGLNEFKLKEGFRRLYNTSPHRRLTELRMRRAYHLLETGCHVAQAAYQVGYRYPNNFSAAFTTFFGRSPKSVFGLRREAADDSPTGDMPSE